MKVYQCPQCGRSDGLWEGVDVPGWRTVNEKLEPVRSGSPDRDIDWDRAEGDGDYGCSHCNWEGRKSFGENYVVHPPTLVELDIGIDGQPLPLIADGQERLDIEAA